MPVAVIAALLAAGTLAWWRLGNKHPPTPSPGATADPRVAYEKGTVLVRQGKFVESLQLLRSAAEGAPDLAQLHHDYATAILNAVHQGRRHLGRQEFAVRSSVERVAMVREALRELAEGERIAGKDVRQVAWDKRTTAQAMGVWGFPWEALVGYRQAEWTDPSWTEIAGRADHIMDEMQHPENVRER
ncbi:MAG: hypothetical protein E6K80_00565 [Candidatus Eisenbacteria bacterium]|uniref:Tetratricopeptide repeat protein n=1 Tax=Eiseniibacteriota bacterium TaxID=2212470 RepID=A0A538UBL3_UNCEI|nr:MAG: hypothetical protein E6K80_00565 [Candidatus Eisenbacteria bacterium]